MGTGPSVVVVGSGIVGAAIAWHLAQSGARVRIVEADEPGGVATRGSWAWINASWGNAEPYFRLRVRAMAEWRRLEREVPGLAVNWCGGLIWDLDAAELDAFAAEHASWGYPIRRLDRAAAAALEPGLAAPPEAALHVAAEGSVEPLAAAEALLAAARGLGVEVSAGTRATGLESQAGRVTGVRTGDGTIAADEVVVAAGVGTPALVAEAGFALPMVTPPGLIVVSRPHRPVLNGLVMAPGVHVRQTAQGQLLAGADFGGTMTGTDVDGEAQTVIAATRALLKDGDGVTFERHLVTLRPTPADGLPAIGRVPGVGGLYVATMHSGITLAPAVGLFAAREIVSGERDPLLAICAPERFSA